MLINNLDLIFQIQVLIINVLKSLCTKLGNFFLVCDIFIFPYQFTTRSNPSIPGVSERRLWDSGKDSEAGSWDGGEECKNPCSGPVCEEMAQLLDHLIDPSVDPCDDFFAFACSSKTRGLTPPVTPIELAGDEKLIRFPPEGFEYIKKFYQSCTTIDEGYTTEEVFANCIKDDGKCTEEELKEYGDIYVQFLKYTKDFFKKTAFPAVLPNWEKDTEDWFGGFGWSWWQVSAQVLKDNFYLAAFHDIERDEFRSNIFFAPLVNRHDHITYENTHPHTLWHKIHIVPMTIPRRFADSDFQRSYAPLVKGLLLSFGADPSTVGDDADRIIQMEQQLSEMGLPEAWSYGFGSGSGSGDSEYDEDYESSGHSEGDFTEELTITELADAVPSVPWKDFLEAALSHKEGFKVRPTDSVVVPDIDLMKQLGDMLEILTPRDRANLLIWRMFIRFVNDFMKTGSKENDLQQDPFAQRCKLPTQSSRRENCICQVNTLFPEAHNDLLIGEYVSKSKKEGIKQLFTDMAEEFEGIIDEQDWMSKRTKFRAKEKVANMGINVGEQSPNTPEFKELKKKMKPNDYINNILAIGNYHYDTLVKLIGSDVKELRERGGDEAERVDNAYYYSEKNEMYILTGIINSFLGKGLSFDLPKSIIYGGHGGLLGHEMVHGFDNNGKAYDKDGFKFNWWTQTEERDYDNRTKCMVGVKKTSFMKYNI